MKSMKMIAGMAVIIFCLAFVGVLSAHEYKREASGFTVERTFTDSSSQFKTNANRWGMNIKTTENRLEDLENAYYYQMIDNQYINMNGNQMENSAPIKDQVEQNVNHPSCKC